MDGLFLEHGPFKVDENLKLNMNPHSWHKVSGEHSIHNHSVASDMSHVSWCFHIN